MIRILLPLLLLGASVAMSATFVEEHGRLQVDGAQIKDKQGNVVPLRGMSFFWSQWASRFYNGEVVDWLVSDWKVTLVRAAMGVNGTTSGYLKDPVGEMAKVDTLVAAAIRNGIYVLVDWHDHEANLHTAEAVDFFGKMAEKYKDVPNVIWEVWNEPLDTASWVNTIKPYAEEVIEAIREHDPDNLVIVGTRTWSQRVDEVVGHEIVDTNVAYTLHFYVGSHGEWLRSTADGAIAAGIPIFVTEWGIWDNGYIDGDFTQPIDAEQTLAWVDWMNGHKLSQAMWSVFDKEEPSAVLQSGAVAEGGWTEADLTTAGVFARNYLRGIDDNSWVRPVMPVLVPDTIALPGRMEAEDYVSQVGIQSQKTEDDEGLRNIGYIENGDYTEYTVKIQETTDCRITVRYASAGVGGSLVILVDGDSLATAEISVTGDWQAWESIHTSGVIPAGLHTIRLEFRGEEGEALYNLNYVDFVASSSAILPWRKLSSLRMGGDTTKQFDLLGRAAGRI